MLTGMIHHTTRGVLGKGTCTHGSSKRERVNLSHMRAATPEKLGANHAPRYFSPNWAPATDKCAINPSKSRWVLNLTYPKRRCAQWRERWRTLAGQTMAEVDSAPTTPQTSANDTNANPSSTSSHPTSCSPPCSSLKVARPSAGHVDLSDRPRLHRNRDATTTKSGHYLSKREPFEKSPLMMLANPDHE